VCNDLNIKECYVGHTTDFKSRKYCHKQSVENSNHNDYNSKKSTFIRGNGGWDNWSMIEIEKIPCNDGREARARERHWYEELNAKLNSLCPIRSKKEYYEENKEHKLEYQNQYREQNREQISEKKMIYYEKNKEQIKKYKSTKYTCECGSIIWQSNKHNHIKTKKHCQFLETNNI
jgi:hypothetical protein